MFKKYIEKYGLPLVIVGVLGKITSLLLVVVLYGHWYGNILPKDSSEVVIYLDPNLTLEQRLLAIENGINDAGGHGDRLLRTIKWRGWGERIKAGKYTLIVGESVGDVAEKFAAGDRGAVKVVVPAGRDLEIIAWRLSSRIAADSVEVFGLIKHDSIRWRIIPNTYEMWWETDAEGAVDRILKEHVKWWNSERVTKANKLGLSPKEVVILASIVQAETSQKSEAPIVAGLYLNRLKKGQPLQADPTLIYAAGDVSIRRVLDIHKEIDSPYNTYMYAGLPPGPIRVPEPSYMNAVLNAEEHDYLYMCAEPGGTGKHNFARRYVDHLRNARKYQKWLNKQQIYR